MSAKFRFLNLIMAIVMVAGMIGIQPASPVKAAEGVIINEVDSDTAGTDALEFIELYDGGVGNTALDGMVVVFFNGSNNLSYAAYDLDGYDTDANGYFLMGNSAVSPTPALIFAGNFLQNGQDAVALYEDNASNFPTGSAVTTDNLVDALVYDTDDADDPELLVLLNAGQPQINENSGSNKDYDSMQRSPDGSGGARNTVTYILSAPTPGAANPDTAPEVTSTTPADSDSEDALNAKIEITYSEPVTLGSDFADITCDSGTHTYTVDETADPLIVLNPDSDFSSAETCTVTITASLVTDDDSNDPPDEMASDYSWSFITVNVEEVAALALVQTETTLSGTLAELTATFPTSPIPAILISEGYQINSRMTLAEELPIGTTVSIMLSVNGGVSFAYVTDAPIPGNPFWVTELFEPDAEAAYFGAGYQNRTETYYVTINSPGVPFDIDTTVTIESIISKDGFTTQQVVLAEAADLAVHIDADEDAALAYVQDNTTLTGSLASLTATFPETIPPVLVDLPYTINSRMTLADSLPDGTTVTIWATVGGVGPFLYVPDALIPGNPFWVTELFEPDQVPADFNDGYSGLVEIYNITINSGGGNPLAIDTTVLIESIISKDNFVTQQVVLDDITLPIHIDADETARNVFIYRVGNGFDALSANGSPVYLDEYTPEGTLVRSIAMPEIADGDNRAFYANGTSTSEGLLTRSTYGDYVLLTGYASKWTSALSGTTGVDVNRVIGRVDSYGNIDTTTALTDFASSGNPRSATSTNGIDLWTTGSNGGVRYVTIGSTDTSIQVSSTVTNNRQANIFEGQLYVSTGSGSYRLYTVGTGLPTTGGQTIANLTGFPTSGSQYSFFFADLDAGVAGLDTLYVADDSTGIQKYSLVSGSWSANGVVGLNADDYRGLTGAVSGTTVRLYATRGGDELATLVDTTGYNVDFSATTPTLLVIADANTAFRGVALAPADNLPTVASTVPANSDSGVAIGTDISVNFSESVTTSAGAFEILCGGVNQTFTLSGSEASYTLNPDSNLPLDTDCTLTVTASMVTDLDGTADAMAIDFSATFHTTGDEYPYVASTTPGTDATNVAIGSDISVTFSENVTTSAAAFTILCDSTNQPFAFSGSGASYTLNPDSDLPYSQICTVTVVASQVTDLDGPPDPMWENYEWSFTTINDPDVITPIATARAAGVGWTGTIQGNVTVVPGRFRTDSFAIQDATGGLYIYAGSYPLPSMTLGDIVKVKGTIKNYNGLLEVDPVINIEWINTGTVPTPEVTATNPVTLALTQGKLIQVQGTVTMTITPPDPGGSDYSFTIDDVSGSVTVFVDKDTNIDMTGFASGQQMLIIGFSGAYFTGPQVQPRYQSDIIDLRPPTVTGTVPINGTSDISPHKPVSATFSKSMDPLSLNTTNFTLTGASSGPVSGSVSYTETTHTAVFTPNSALGETEIYTATLSTSVQDIYEIPLAAAESWSFTTGDLDTTAPTIMTRFPAPDAVDVPASTPVVVTFSEDLAPGSLDLDHFILTDPYGVVPADFDYNPATFTVTLTPEASLLYTTQYTMTVTADTSDYAGHPIGTEDDAWTFSTGVEPPMQTYFGDLHNHTSYSDGSGTPSQALAAGEAAGFDFMAITDHSYAISDGEWDGTLSAVEAATDADFVALRGFEYTQGAEGHINVWNSTRHAVRTNTGCTYCDYTPNLESGVTVTGFYEWLVSESNVGLGGSGTVMQFNHPGWINFNDWFFHPEVSGIARLEEVGNGSGSSYVFSEEEFIRSLDYGWKVGATNNADTHSDQWGTNTENRTGVIMPELTKSALLEAMRLRRTFATEDMNFSLSMKANGAWMGSEIANTGNIVFEITGLDADGELAALVELKSDQGEVVAYSTPNSSNFTWSPEIIITTGVHYYYVKVTQFDGDRIVSSPVWTMGSEDIAITDLTIQPTIPTIHNASLLTVRVTNRVTESRDVSIILKIDGIQEGTAKDVSVPANGDGYANFSWQPLATGDVTITAELQGAPAGDNPDDNSASLYLDVTDDFLPLILIDASHGNMNAAGNDMKPFIDDLSDHNYNVLKNLDTLTADDLNTDVVKLLIITAPETAYTTEERDAIANYVAAGGNLWIGGLADYTGSVPWAATVADRENAILATIETVTGQTINMRMNDDEVIDGNTNNGYVFGVIWQNFPSASTTGIGLNVENVSTWSLNSIVDGNGEALTAATTGVQIVMQGDLDVGCTADSWHNPFHTGNTDADGAGDAFIYNPGWTCDLTEPPVGAVPLPGAAVVDLSPLGAGAGRIMLYGDSNDPFTIFAYTAGDGKQNELFNLESVMWLLGEPLDKSTIAEARAQAVEDQPDNLNNLVWVEGEITAAYGEFFNVLYVQDETGGITVHAPAGDIDAGAFPRGTHVRAIGTIGIYNGDTEIEFFEAEQVQVIDPSTYDATPLPLTTAQANLESNEGWLTVVTGRVISKSGTDTIVVYDGSVPVRVFLDGYNGTLADILVNDDVQVTGLVSEDGDGARIRVRNHNYHAGVPDDVLVLGHTYMYYMLNIYK
jgi:methionine-rich copper-binding protein CopC/uncharacterized protein YdeI (BOF family)